MDEKKTEENFINASKRMREALEQFEDIEAEKPSEDKVSLLDVNKAQTEMVKKIKELMKDLS